MIEAATDRIEHRVTGHPPVHHRVELGPHRKVGLREAELVVAPVPHVAWIEEAAVIISRKITWTLKAH